MRTLYSHEIDASMDGQKVRIAGWVSEIRALGGLNFVIIRDREGYAQVTVRKKDAPKEVVDALSDLAKESVVSVSGTVKKMKEAPRGAEVIPDRIEVLSKAQSPLPLDISGKIESELDTRLTSRFMDLRKQSSKATFMVRNCLLRGMRDYLDSKGYIEIHTPKILSAAAEGGATVFKVKYFDKEAYLAQSPQFFKQTMMATGFDRVYEIAPAFRAEESATVRHLAEFTSFDLEVAFIKSYEDLLAVQEELIVHAFSHAKKHAAPYLELVKKDIEVPKTPFLRLKHDECTKLLGLKKWHDITDEGEKKLGEIVKKEHGADFFFMTEFPASLKKTTFYAKRLDEDPDYTGYFDLVYKGQELASGGPREHRYDRLVAQLKEQNLPIASFEFYLNAFKYGMPPHGGFGLGIDRFVQKVLDLPNVREAVLFPRDRFRLVP